MTTSFEFFRFGEVVEPRRGHVFLDLGNRLEPGVIDHHFREYEGENFECTSSLIVKRPELVTSWISTADLQREVTIVVHQDPDFDCIVSSYLALQLLEAKEAGRALPEGWGDWAPFLADAARRVDRGETRLDLQEGDALAPVTPYLSVLLLSERAGQRGLWGREKWKWQLQEGHRIISSALKLQQGDEPSFEKMDLRGRVEGIAEMAEMVDKNLAFFGRDLRRLGLDGPQVKENDLDGIEAVELFAGTKPGGVHSGNMAFILNPECNIGFFKSLMRGSFFDRVQATCIFTTVPADKHSGSEEWVRAVVSVDPESTFSLRGLGKHLDFLETEARLVLGMKRTGPARPGYDNSDPWFDGRSFEYTIVDAPRWGTVLPPERIKAAVLDSPAWHLCRNEDILLRSKIMLRNPLSTAFQREAALRDICGILPSGRDSGKSPGRRFRELERKAIAVLADHLTSEDLKALADDMEEVQFSLVTLLLSKCKSLEARAVLMSTAARMVGGNPDLLKECAEHQPYLADPLRFASLPFCLPGTQTDDILSTEAISSKSASAYWLDACSSLSFVSGELAPKVEKRLLEVLSLKQLSSDMSFDRLSSVFSLLDSPSCSGKCRAELESIAGVEIDALVDNMATCSSLGSFTRQWPRWKRALPRALRVPAIQSRCVERLEKLAQDVSLPGYVRTAAGNRGPSPLFGRKEERDIQKDWLEALSQLGTSDLGLWDDAIVSAQQTLFDLFDHLLAAGQTHQACLLVHSMSKPHILLRKVVEDLGKRNIKPEELEKRQEIVKEAFVGTISELLKKLLNRLSISYEAEEVPRGISALLDDIYDDLHTILGGGSITTLFWKCGGVSLLTPGLRKVIIRDILESEPINPKAVPVLLSILFSGDGLQLMESFIAEWAGPGPASETVLNLRGLAQIAAVVAARKINLESPAYMVPALVQLSLPLLHDGIDGGNSGIFREAYNRGVNLLATHFDQSNERAYEQQLYNLGALFRSEIQYSIPKQAALYHHLMQAMSHAELLLRVKDFLSVIETEHGSPLSFFQDMIDWVVMGLPSDDSRKRVAAFSGYRNTFSTDFNNSTEGLEAEWLCSRLEEALAAFENGELGIGVTSIEIRTVLHVMHGTLENRCGDGISLLANELMRGVETYLTNKLAFVERLERVLKTAGATPDKDDLTLDILELSTLDWLRNEFHPAAGLPTPDDLVKTQGALIAAWSSTVTERKDQEIQEAETLVSEVRFQLGKKEERGRKWQRILEIIDEPAKSGPGLNFAGALYNRVKSHLHVGPQLIDQAFLDITQKMIRRYELGWAKKRIEQYCLTPMGWSLKFWLSGGIVAIPLAFMVLFWVAASTSYGYVSQYGLEFLLVGTLGFAAVAAWRLTRRRLSLAQAIEGPRAKNHVNEDVRRSSRLKQRAKASENLKLQLFLPQYVIPVIIGVYTVSLTDEVALKIGNLIDGPRLAFLLIGFMFASFWAVKELIKKEGGISSNWNSTIASLKIFSYSFFAAMAVNLIVAPLIMHEQENCRKMVMGLPFSISTLDLPSLFTFNPRHILLYATLGMFVGVFLHGIVGFRSE